MVNVFNYGAIGDGIVDDTAAFLSAFAASRDIVAPAGFTYKLTNQGATTCLALNNGYRLHGEGKDTILKIGNGENSSIIEFGTFQDMGVYDLTIDGNVANNTAGHAIRGSGNTDIEIRNVQIKNTAGYGMGFQTGSFKRVTIENCVVTDTGNDGIDFKNPNNDNVGISIRGVTVERPGRITSNQAGIDIRGVAHLNDIWVSGLDDDQAGIRFREDGGGTVGAGGHFSSFSNVYIEGTGADSVAIYAPASRVKGENIYITGVGIGIHLAGIHNSIGNAHVNAAQILGYLMDVNSTYSSFHSNCVARSGAGKGFKIEADYARISGVIAQGNTGAGIEITGNSTSAIVSTSTFRSNGAANIKNGVSTIDGGDNYAF